MICSSERCIYFPVLNPVCIVPTPTHPQFTLEIYSISPFQENPCVLFGGSFFPNISGAVGCGMVFLYFIPNIHLLVSKYVYPYRHGLSYWGDFF